MTTLRHPVRRVIAGAARHPARLVVPLAAALALTACSSSSTTVATTPTGSGPTAAASAPAAPAPAVMPAITELKLATTTLGEVVVDGKGMTLYMFTKDTQGGAASACTGACLAAWPLVVADGIPNLTGVTGSVGSIPTADGRKQVTLNGWPLYYFAKDKAAGDVTGQGVNSVWYVLDKAGTPVKK